MFFDLSTFIAICRHDASTPHAIESIERLMRRTVAHPGAVAARLCDASRADETLLYVSKDLTIYHIALPPRTLYGAPHEHRMTALVGLYVGEETNLLYRRTPTNRDRIEPIGRLDLKAPDVVVLGPETIHAVGNPGRIPSAALHVYLGHLIQEPRGMWPSEGEEECPFANDVYLASRRPFHA